MPKYARHWNFPLPTIIRCGDSLCFLLKKCRMNSSFKLDRTTLRGKSGITYKEVRKTLTPRWGAVWRDMLLGWIALALIVSALIVIGDRSLVVALTGRRSCAHRVHDAIMLFQRKRRTQYSRTSGGTTCCPMFLRVELPAWTCRVTVQIRTGSSQSFWRCDGHRSILQGSAESEVRRRSVVRCRAVQNCPDARREASSRGEPSAGKSRR